MENETYNDFVRRLFENKKKPGDGYPVKAEVYYFADTLMSLLFPHFSKKFCTSYKELEAELTLLKVHLGKTLKPLYPDDSAKIDSIVNEFFGCLPEIYDMLHMDAESIETGDPAAENLDEVIITYPGFYAIAIYRFAHKFYSMNVPIFPRLLTEYAHRLTGIDIHPGAKIGKQFFIDHGTGIVIGETSQIGNCVKLYQGVTLGALSVDKKEADKKRHPTVEDNVIIYSGATILGGETVIGHDSIIGGNCWLIESVQPYSVVYSKNEIEVRSSHARDEKRKIPSAIKLNK